MFRRLKCRVLGHRMEEGECRRCGWESPVPAWLVGLWREEMAISAGSTVRIPRYGKLSSEQLIAEIEQPTTST